MPLVTRRFRQQRSQPLGAERLRRARPTWRGVHRAGAALAPCPVKPGWMATGVAACRSAAPPRWRMLALTDFSPTFPGFYLYYPSRGQQPSRLKAFVDYALAHAGKRW